MTNHQKHPTVTTRLIGGKRTEIRWMDQQVLKLGTHRLKITGSFASVQKKKVGKDFTGHIDDPFLVKTFVL